MKSILGSRIYPEIDGRNKTKHVLLKDLLQKPFIWDPQERKQAAVLLWHFVPIRKKTEASCNCRICLAHQDCDKKIAEKITVEWLFWKFLIVFTFWLEIKSVDFEKKKCLNVNKSPNQTFYSFIAFYKQTCYRLNPRLKVSILYSCNCENVNVEKLQYQHLWAVSGF